MGVSTKPQDDAKAMTDEYVKGATIADLAVKYNHSEQEVLEVVTKDGEAEPTVLQAEQPTEVPAEEVKEEKKK